MHPPNALGSDSVLNTLQADRPYMDKEMFDEKRVQSEAILKKEKHTRWSTIFTILACTRTLSFFLIIITFWLLIA